MTNFFIIKEKVTKFYKDFESYFQIAFKFLVAFFVFGLINDKLGYFEILNNIGIRVVLSLISAIVPSSVFVLLAAIVSLLHLYKLSLVMMILAFIVFVVFYFLYLKFAPKHGVLMMVIPVLMPLNLHFIVPLIAGLFFSPFTIVPVASSFILMKIIQFIIEAAPMVDGGKLDVVAIVAAYQYVIDHVIENKEMILYGAVFALIIVLTYVVSRFPFDYAWYVGIGVGTVAGIAGLFVGGGMLGVDISAAGVIFGALLSGVIVAVIQFLRCSVDYSRKEFVQFEDDDYFYYVKAIPKITAVMPESRKQNHTEKSKQKHSDFKESVKQMFVSDDNDSDFDEDFDDVFDEPSRTRTKKVTGHVKEQKEKFRQKSVKQNTQETENTPLVSDKTQVFDLDMGDRIPSEKQPEIIIPEIKMPARTVPKTVSIKPAEKRTESDKAEQIKKEDKVTVQRKPEKPAAAPKKNIRASYDFDFDDDDYDDSMEDYGTDDSDFSSF